MNRSQAPSIMIVERGLVLSDRTAFTIEASWEDSPDIMIVIDLYDMDNPVHPDGHVGWWKFVPGRVPPKSQAVFVRRADGMHVTLDDAGPTDFWFNSAVRTDRLIVHAVLRSNATNALIAIDQVPALPSDAALSLLRQQVDRNWSRPRFAAPHFVPRDGTSVHLVAPNIYQRDAVGNLCLELYRLLRQNGISVRLYAERADLSLSDLIVPQSRLSRHVEATDCIVYFYSTVDPSLAELVELPGRKAAYFHGITSAASLRVFDPELAANAWRALSALPALARFEELAANSRHSAEQLAAAVGRPADCIHVIPPRLLAPDETVGSRDKPDVGRDLICVAQLNPHKKIEDVLRLFAAYRKRRPDARCHVVGRQRGQAYRDYLNWVETKELALPPGAVLWHGSISDDELLTRYRDAAALVSMSEHEGFCLPLFEAMGAGTLVFAYGIPAVRETLGDAGIAFAEKDHDNLASQLCELLDDQPRYARVMSQQALRYAALRSRMTGREFLALLEPAWPSDA